MEIKLETEVNSKIRRSENPREFTEGGFRIIMEKVLIETKPHGECILEKRAGEDLVIRIVSGCGFITPINQSGEKEAKKKLCLFFTMPSVILDSTKDEGEKFSITSESMKTVILISSTIIRKT